MWKIFTSLGDISSLLETILKGIGSLLKAWKRKREIGQVQRTDAEINSIVDNANKTGDVTDINKKLGF